MGSRKVGASIHLPWQAGRVWWATLRAPFHLEEMIAWCISVHKFIMYSYQRNTLSQFTLGLGYLRRHLNSNYPKSRCSLFLSLSLVLTTLLTSSSLMHGVSEAQQLVVMPPSSSTFTALSVLRDISHERCSLSLPPAPHDPDLMSAIHYKLSCRHQLICFLWLWHVLLHVSGHSFSQRSKNNVPMGRNRPWTYWKCMNVWISALLQALQKYKAESSQQTWFHKASKLTL